MASSCYDEGSSSQQNIIKRFLLTTINTAKSLAETIRLCSLHTVKTSRKKKKREKRLRKRSRSKQI